MDTIEKAYYKIKSLIDIITVLLLYGVAVIIIGQVFLRYVFRAPLRWPAEISRLFVVWITFLGTFLALDQKKHIGISYFVERLSKKAQRWENILVQILVLVFIIFMTLSGWRFTVANAHRSLTISGLSYIFVYGVFPLTGILMALKTIFEITLELRYLLTDESEGF